MSLHVFLGPSLPAADARALLDAEFHPPARSGDACALMVRERKPHAIVLIDGLFERVPSVWHKELLYALSEGVRVFGASSMGALRAAELAPFGMKGVGSVYEAFASGALEDDDEVAVSHGAAEDGYRSLSVAMVNLRAGLDRAVQAGIVRPLVRDALVARTKSQFYPDRSWEQVFRDTPAAGGTEHELTRLQQFVRTEKPDVKREDAVAVLRHVAELRGRLLEPAPPASFDFEPTVHFRALLEARRAAHRAEGSPLSGLARHVRVHLRSEPSLLHDALFLSLLEARGTPSAELSTEVQVERLVHEDWAEQVDAHLPAALKRAGRFEAVVDVVRKKQAHLAARGIENPTLADANITLDALLDGYRTRSGLTGTTPEALSAAVGISEPREFLNELLAHYLYEQAERR